MVDQRGHGILWCIVILRARPCEGRPRVSLCWWVRGKALNWKIICKWNILHCHVWLQEAKHFISNLYAFYWDTISSLYIGLKNILPKGSCSLYHTNLYHISIIFCRRTISRNPQKIPEKTVQKTVQQPLHRRWRGRKPKQRGMKNTLSSCPMKYWLVFIEILFHPYTLIW